MTSACPAIRVLMATLAALLLMMTAATTASADPQPGPTALTTSVEVRPDSLVVVAGTLSDQAGAPVPGASINVRINGDAQAEGVTNGEGGYLIDFTLAEALRTEAQELVVVFEGRDDLDASQATATVGPVPTSGQPPATPPDERLDVTLDAGTASSTVSAGGLVIIEGTLVDQNGGPVGGVRIRVMLDDDESSDSLVMTDETGAFQTFAEVPPERPAGEASLVVSFNGNNGYKAMSQEIGLVVERIPVANRVSPEPSPTASDVPGATASVDASMAAADDKDASKADEGAELSPLSWFYVALVVVGGAALLITAGLVFRGMYGRRSDTASRRAGSLDMLLDQASEDTETTGPLDTSDEVVSGQTDADEGTAGTTRPRRGEER